MRSSPKDYFTGQAHNLKTGSGKDKLTLYPVESGSAGVAPQLFHGARPRSKVKMNPDEKIYLLLFIFNGINFFYREPCISLAGL
jgi:hypothetical protein